MKASIRTSLACFCVAVCASVSATAQPARDTTLTAPDFTSVIIVRDTYGVPHISASTELALFYGQGYAAAEDRLFQMESFRRITLGREAEIYGPSSLASDQATITLVYTDAERTAQFNALSSGLKTILTAYKDGINAYLANVIAEPAKFKPREFDVLNIPVVNYEVEDLLAIIQGFLIGFGGNGGDELTRLQQLGAMGQSAFDAMYPINDASAPTSIPSPPTSVVKKWTYSGISVTPEATRAVEDLRSRVLVGMPKFGSFATIVDAAKSSSGNVQLLGAPQMGPPVITEPSRTMEVELISPTIHVGGMSVAGAPGVIIGHNEDLAWTLTSGQSDNTDVFVETTNVSGTQYLFNSVLQNFESLINNIPVLGQSDDMFAHFRTVHGPVVGADVPNQQAFTVQSTYREQELAMMQGLHDIWKASTLAGFEAGVAQFPMSFNVLYAGEHTGSGTQIVKYYHAGKYQDRTDGVDPRLPHSGIGDEEWGGFRSFASLPQADGSVQDYFVNWNNKPIASWDQGDNMPWIVGNVFRDRVNSLASYVSSTTPFSYANLKNIPSAIGDHGTYTQAIEIAPSASAAMKSAQTGTFTDESLNPPGQSGFVSIAQDSSAHFRDQWPLHLSFGFKDMIFSPESLPVSLTDFRAVTDEATVTLLWKTGSSFVDTRFEVQQSVHAATNTGALWTTIAVVDPNNDNRRATDHRYQVNNLKSGRYLFRLRMIDFDGSFTFSPTVSVLLGTVGENDLSDVYPNPAGPRAEFTLTLKDPGQTTIDVFDILGRRVDRLFDGILSADEQHKFFVETDRLRNGMFTVVVRSGSFRANKKITVVR